MRGAPLCPPDLYKQFLQTAERISPALRDDIAAIGPLWFPEREDHGVALFMARAVIGQSLSTKAARTIWSRIEAAAANAGTTLPEFFRDDDAAAIKACGASSNKVKALVSIREAELTGHVGPLIHAMDHVDRSAHLAQIWGIGQWTCDMVSIFYCRDPDVWPEGDVAVQKAFGRYLGRRKPAKAAAAFTPYRSVLALYMWRIVDGVM